MTVEPNRRAYEAARSSCGKTGRLARHVERCHEIGKTNLPDDDRPLPRKWTIRRELAEHGEGIAGVVLSGAITLIYRAERGGVRHALAQTQSDFLKEVISSQHVFLDEDQSLEVPLVQGPSERLNSPCDRLRKIRGVRQITLVSTRALLPPLHAHVGGQDR